MAGSGLRYCLFRTEKSSIRLLGVSKQQDIPHGALSAHGNNMTPGPVLKQDKAFNFASLVAGRNTSVFTHFEFRFVLKTEMCYVMHLLQDSQLIYVPTPSQTNHTNHTSG